MTIKEMFNKAITDAFKSAYLITEEDKKAVALAQIAAALAQTGAIAPSDIEESSEKKEVETTEKKKEAKSHTPKKKQGEKLQKQPYDLPEKEEKEAQEEVEMAEEWTDETMQRYDAELKYIEDFVERNDNDDSAGLLDSCVGEFSSGVLHSFDDITPRNIVSFVSWLKDIEAAGASEENDG